MTISLRKPFPILENFEGHNGTINATIYIFPLLIISLLAFYASLDFNETIPR
jgi:hypothetical protein